MQEGIHSIGRIILCCDRNRIQVDNGKVRLEYSLLKGSFSYWVNGIMILKEAQSESLTDGFFIGSTDHRSHTISDELTEEINDALGHGFKLVIQSSTDQLPVMRQIFYIYEEQNFILIQTEIESPFIIESNYTCPLAVKDIGFNGNSFDLGPKQSPTILRVPFDNDKFVRYMAVDKIQGMIESYEVSSIYNPRTRCGLVIGSVDHDMWKTGIRFNGTSGDILSIEVYAGAVGELTHDILPHGSVSGNVISSPRMFLGFYTDFRIGLEQFGMVNAKLTPPLRWNQGVPFGWNSWAAAENTINYELYHETSDFIANHLQGKGFHSQEQVYINFDSFWDNLSEQQLIHAAQHVRTNGQKPGIYWSPFAFWGTDFDQFVEGTNGKYTFKDILLKDLKGCFLPELDGGLSIDPTHPGTLSRIRWQVNRFIQWGYEYVKLDFLSHATREGNHYAKQIKTGIQAYNYGMNFFIKQLEKSPKDRPFFVSLSIAPLFPHQYGHARRISCDAWGSIYDSEYMLNSLTFGWWTSGTIYPFNDPDHVVLYKSHKREPVSQFEGKTRFHSAVISGTVLMDSDDFRLEEARKRAIDLLVNDNVNQIARMGISFRPVEVPSGDRATDTFFMTHPESKESFLAVFNYHETESIIKNIDLDRLGIKNIKGFDDLWTNEFFQCDSLIFTVLLEATESRLFRIIIDH